MTEWNSSYNNGTHKNRIIKSVIKFKQQKEFCEKTHGAKWNKSNMSTRGWNWSGVWQEHA